MATEVVKDKADDLIVADFKTAEPKLYKKISHLFFSEIKFGVKEQIEDKSTKILGEIKREYIPYLTALFGNMLVLKNLNQGKFVEDKVEVSRWIKSLVGQISHIDASENVSKKFLSLRDLAIYPIQIMKDKKVSPAEAVKLAEKEIYTAIESIYDPKTYGFSWDGYLKAADRFLAKTIELSANKSVSQAKEMLGEYGNLLQISKAQDKKQVLLSARKKYKSNLISKTESAVAEKAGEFKMSSSLLTKSIDAIYYQLNKLLIKQNYNQQEKSIAVNKGSKELLSQTLLLGVVGDYMAGLSNESSLISAIIHSDPNNENSAQLLRCIAKQYSLLDYINEKDCLQIIKNINDERLTIQFAASKSGAKAVLQNYIDTNKQIDIVSYLSKTAQNNLLKYISKDTFSDEELSFYIWQHSVDVYLQNKAEKSKTSTTSTSMPASVKRDLLMVHAKALCRLDYYAQDDATSKSIAEQVKDLTLVACCAEEPEVIKEICGSQSAEEVIEQSYKMIEKYASEFALSQKMAF